MKFFMMVNTTIFSQWPCLSRLFQFFTMDQIKDKLNQGEKFHPEFLFLLNKYWI